MLSECPENPEHSGNLQGIGFCISLPLEGNVELFSCTCSELLTFKISKLEKNGLESLPLWKHQMS